MIDMFTRARKVSTPIVVIHTADQVATVEALCNDTSEDPGIGQNHVVVTWDASAGAHGYIRDTEDDKTSAGAKFCRAQKWTADNTTGFVEALQLAIGQSAQQQALPMGGVLFMFNAHRQLVSMEPGATASAIQAVANVRDHFKSNLRTLVLLCPAMTVPPEFAQDVVVLRHALPGPEKLCEIVDAIAKAASLPVPEPEMKAKVVEATSGLSAFAAEQVIALSLTKEGINLDQVWERKRVAIEQTPGLKVWRGKERFDDIVGLDAIKRRLTRRLSGRSPIGVVVWLDEIDKVLANVEHDTSGVRMDQLRTLLTEMENNEWEGVLAAGLPGGGKSLLAKAFGNEAGVPTIALDLAAMEGSLVGESEARLRHAVSVIHAVGGGRAYIFATSNNATVMRPELQRRFTGGFFWFDIVTKAEREAAWAYYTTKYGLDVSMPRPDDDAWTAAEVRNCCREAWNSNLTLVEAAEFIIPVAQARGAEFDEMRKAANGRFLDASKPGKFAYTAAPMEKRLRAISIDGSALAGITTMKES